MDGMTTRNRGYPRRSGYSREDRDFYVEPRWVARLLLDAETFTGAVVPVERDLAFGRVNG
jgi:hypothetical protein